MSSTQNLQPENADTAEDAEDVSIPLLSNRFRLLVVPKELQGPLFSKTYRTRGSGRILGKLKGFMDLPLDVVFETAMYLAPKDLLQLSRLSKQFRSMFASRSALFIWQTVFRNADLKCFEDLNEIQFASLLYDKFCMGCGRITKGCLLFSVLRLRLCSCCQSVNVVTKDFLLNQYPNAKDLIVTLPASWSYKYFKPEADILINKFLSLKERSSRDLFIANMVQHTRARHGEVGINFNFRGTLQALFFIRFLIFSFFLKPGSTQDSTPNFRRRRVKWSCRGYTANR